MFSEAGGPPGLRRFFAAGLWLLSALVSIPLCAADPPALEDLYGASRHAEDLAITVRSRGCTQAADFEVVADESSLRIVRRRPDRCRRSPTLLELYLDLPPRSAPLRLENPLLIPASPGPVVRER